MLVLTANANCQYIAACAVQYTVSGRTHKQGETVATMTAHNNEVGLNFPGQRVDFCFWPTHHNMTMGFIDTVRFGEAV